METSGCKGRSNQEQYLCKALPKPLPQGHNSQTTTSQPRFKNSMGRKCVNACKNFPNCKV
eukprot:13231735-Ditylum_brightwellii.AAC.1